MTIQQDRDAALEVVRTACADGLIIEADRDQRIEQIKSAQTQTEIDVVLGNLKQRATPPQAPEFTTAIPGVQTFLKSMGGGGSGGGRPLVFGPLIGGLVAVVIGIAVVVFVVNLLSGVDTGSSSNGTPGNPQASPARPGEDLGDGTSATGNVISKEGWEELLAAIKKQTGGTAVFDATLYPKYAVLELPVDRETQRSQDFYWDGKDLEDRDSFGRSTDARLDLATINFDAALRLTRRVATLIENPTSYYLIFGAPDKFDGAVMYAYASNKFSEGGYISADADGKRIRKVTW